jgi:hypothetical protein
MGREESLLKAAARGDVQKINVRATWPLSSSSHCGVTSPCGLSLLSQGILSLEGPKKKEGTIGRFAKSFKNKSMKVAPWVPSIFVSSVA